MVILVDFRQQLVKQLKNNRPSVCTLGTFDGVHIGHKGLLETTKTEAQRRQARSLAVVFRNQPKELIELSSKKGYLTSFNLRKRLLEEQNLDGIAYIDFDQSIREMSAHQFLQCLKNILGVNVFILGPGAKLGHDRASIYDLSKTMTQSGIEIIEAISKDLNGMMVSSSSIRKEIESGNVESASKMLGRPYMMTGAVEHGEKRGTKIGFPTANIGLTEPLVIPADGVYASLITFDNKEYHSATSVGVRPTFGQNRRTIESYIIDFSGTIYNKNIELKFIKRLRNELKFASVDLLVEQMKNDIEKTRQVLAII